MRRFSLFALALSCWANVAAAVEIPTACSEHSPWGVPEWTGAEPALTSLCRTGYVSLHDDEKLVPEFVSWRLTSDHALGCLKRKDSFAADPDLPEGRRAELQDYKGYAGTYDRGHFAPNADFAWDAHVQRESFLLSNMSPQASHLNQWQWEELEAVTRSWTLGRGTLIIMDGPIWRGTPATIGPNKVAVPAAYWKVVVDLATNEAVAFMMNNEPTPKGDLAPFAVSIGDVEIAAGFRLPLPATMDRTRVTTPWPGRKSEFLNRKREVCGASS